RRSARSTARPVSAKPRTWWKRASTSPCCRRTSTGRTNCHSRASENPSIRQHLKPTMDARFRGHDKVGLAFHDNHVVYAVRGRRRRREHVLWTCDLERREPAERQGRKLKLSAS